MKRMRFALGCALAALALFAAAGCSSDGGSGSGVNYNAAGSASPFSAEEGTVVRNKVVSVGDSEDVFYEYLTFSDASSGAYAVYRDSDGEKEKVTKISIGGVETVLPSSFTYDAATGKVSAGGNTAYMLNAKKSGKDVFVTASEVLETDGDDKATLLNRWKSASDGKYEFHDGGTVVTDNGTFEFTNDSGWIMVSGNVPFYWAKLSDGFSLYYMIFETERENAEAEGRSAALDGEVCLVSERFLLIR